MDFKQLQSFITVVEEKSFTKAAEKTFISQPTISTHIRTLEEELQTKLLIRSTKSLEITPKGMELYQVALKILQLKEDLIKGWKKEDQSIIRVAASTLPSAYILPEILPLFIQEYPNTYFVIQQGDSETVIQQILDDQCSIGLIGKETSHKNLKCLPFYRDQMVIITPIQEKYLKMKQKDSLDILELLKEPMILRESGSGTQINANRLLKRLKIEEKDLHITARINDPESIKNLVASGLGISMISRKAASNYVKENRLLDFDFPLENTTRDLYLIYKKDYYLQKSQRKFIDFVLQFYK